MTTLRELGAQRTHTLVSICTVVFHDTSFTPDSVLVLVFKNQPACMGTCFTGFQKPTRLNGDVLYTTLPLCAIVASIQPIVIHRGGGGRDTFLGVTDGVSEPKNGLVESIFHALHDGIKINSRQPVGHFFSSVLLFFS
jgi:hypothetical protein